MRKMRKNFVMYLVFSLLIAMSLAYGVSADTYRDGDLTYSEDIFYQDVTITGCASSATSVKIPKEFYVGFRVCPVTEIGSSAFKDCINLASVTMPDSVTKIGDSAFSGCTALTSITIPNSVTEIGDSAFSDCTGLTSITIPDSVTSIGNSVFSGCTGLTSITIEDGVTSIYSSLTFGERAF